MTTRRTPPPLPNSAFPAASVPTAGSTPALVSPQGGQPRRRSLLWRALIGLSALAAIAVGGAWLLDASIDPAEEARTLAPVDRTLMAGVRAWGYQLQRLDVAQVAAAPLDLVVVDETLDGHLRPASIQRTLASLKQKPDSGRRVVLAYLSIGEAEDYRRYWQAGWVAAAKPTAPAPELANPDGSPPARANVPIMAPAPLQPLHAPTKDAPVWLGPENMEWRGNYRVRYWHPDWQNLMFGQNGAALDRIIAAGFDGIYLDRADVHETWRSEHPTAKADMIKFIERLAAYARQQRPGFLVVMQNAEELLSTPACAGHSTLSPKRICCSESTPRPSLTTGATSKPVCDS